MTQESELELAQRLLLETQPKGLRQMVPLTTIDPPGVPMREAPFDLGIPAKSQLGPAAGGGGNLPSFEGIVLNDGILKYAQVNGILGDDV